MWGLANRKQRLVEEELQATRCRGRSWIGRVGPGAARGRASRPPSCRAAATARPSWNRRASPTSSTPGSTGRPPRARSAPASLHPTDSSRRPPARRVTRALRRCRGRDRRSRGGPRRLVRSGHRRRPRRTRRASLAAHGADLVVADLSELWPHPTRTVHRSGPRATGSRPRRNASSPRLGVPGGSLAAGRAFLQPRLRGADRDDLRAVQRIPRIRGFVRGRGAVVPAGDPSQRLPRDLADLVSGAGLRIRHHGSDHPAGSGRHDHPPVRRRGPDHLPDNGGPRVRTHAGHGARHPRTVRRVPAVGRSEVPRAQHAVRVPRPAPPRLHPLRDDSTGRTRPSRRLLGAGHHAAGDADGHRAATPGRAGPSPGDAAGRRRTRGR